MKIKLIEFLFSTIFEIIECDEYKELDFEVRSNIEQHAFNKIEYLVNTMLNKLEK